MSIGSQPSASETGIGDARTGAQASVATLGVCHISSGDRWAGAEVQLTALLKGLRQRPDLTVCAIFLNEGRPAEEARQIGIDVCVFDEAQQSFCQILLGAGHFLAGRNVQVLHSHRYKENLLAALLARRCHVPVHVSSQHGAPEPFVGWRRYKQSLIRALDRWVARHSTNSVISVSEDLRGQLMRYVPPHKVVTIYNGIDAEKVYSPLSVSDAKQRLGLPVGCWVIGTAGRLDPIKRLDLFLAAAREIAGAQPNSRFIIAGEGKEESRLRSLASSLGLKDRVLFLGHRDDVYDILRAMDISVLCSDHEGLPMVLLETLYLGIPVVARPVGGVAEVVQDGVNGVLVKSAEPSALAKACLQLLHDDARRRRLAKEGVSRVATQFTADRSAGQVARLYYSLYEARRHNTQRASSKVKVG